MHTDRKIGFAMGILLIGIVTALFFRNEPLLSTRVSGVRREQELNQELRERDVAVYLNDKDSDKTVDQSSDTQPWTLQDVLRNMDERNKTAPVPVGARSFSDRSLTRTDEESLDGYRPSKNRKQAEPISALPPAVDRSEKPKGGLFTTPESRTDSGKFGALPPLMPVESADPVAVRPAKSPAAPPVVSKDLAAPDFCPPESYEEYVVKYGDTLSGIAQRMLGAQSKYMDIYNANRDRMASPDRLDVGKPLRIPRVAETKRSIY